MAADALPHEFPRYPVPEGFAERLLADRRRLIEDYRIALRARFADGVEARWASQGKAKFAILGAGQEIAQIAAAAPLRPGDWMRGYYRGFAEMLRAERITLRQAFAQVLGNAEPGADPASGGRMMGRHFGTPLLDADGDLIDLTAQINRGSDVSSIASQMGPALGMALASKIFRENPGIEARFPGLTRGGEEITHVSIGDGGCAEGVFHECLMQAVVQEVPLVVSVYKNQYGISVPVSRQVPHGSISKTLSGLRPETPGAHGLHIIGPVRDWDYEEVHAAYEEAYAYARQHRKPVLVEVLVTQQEGHSSSGDHRRYKTPEYLEWERAHDGIPHFRQWLIDHEVATEASLAAMEGEERAHVESEAAAAWQEYYQPILATARRALTLFAPALPLTQWPGAIQEQIDGLSGRLDPGSSIVFTRGDILEYVHRALLALSRVPHDQPEKAALIAFYESLREEGQERYSSNIYAPPEKSATRAPHVPPRYSAGSLRDTQAHILAAGAATLMSEDPRIVITGEDEGRIGGVNGGTLGLQGGAAQAEPKVWAKSPALQRYIPEGGFGQRRIWDWAIAENSIAGAAAGAALRGLRPWFRMQYLDYADYALQQIIDEIGCVRHRTAGGQEVPLLISTPGHRLLGMWHGGSPLLQFLAIPGLQVVSPRDAVQAIGLYRAALEHGRDPVFAVEPLADLFHPAAVPDNLDEVCVPLGHSEVLREGSDVTIVTYGHCCRLAVQAAETLEKQGIAAEIVDLQSLRPLDLNDVAGASLRKTRRVLFVDEDYGGGAIRTLAVDLLERSVPGRKANAAHLKCLPRFLGAPEHKPAYGPDGGFFSKPQGDQVIDTIMDMMST